MDSWWSANVSTQLWASGFLVGWFANLIFHMWWDDRAERIKQFNKERALDRLHAFEDDYEKRDIK